MAKRAGELAGRWKISDGLVLTVILFACFTGAGLAGCAMVMCAGEDCMSTLSAYLRGYMAILDDGTAASASLWSVIWELCRWPLLSLLLGMTALGAVAIPVIFCARGFLLAYSIASFVRVFGFPGILAALSVLGMTALASVPVLFCIGTLSFSNSLRLAAGVWESRSASLPYREMLWCLIPCAGLLLLAVVLQWSLMPQLLLFAAEMLSSL